MPIFPALNEAYMILFGSEPGGKEPWQIAGLVLEGGIDDDPRITTALARRCVFEIVNYVPYPDDRKRISLVGWAEELARDLWPGLTDEPHMDDIAWLERCAWVAEGPTL